MPSASPRLFLLPALVLSLAAACSSGGNSNSPSGSGGSGAGGNGAGGGAGGSGGGNESCPQAKTLLDVSKAPGATGYEKPTLSGSCTATHFVVDSNDMPTYDFMQTTPNPLKAVPAHYEIPIDPQVAATPTDLPLLGTVGFAVNGIMFFGPNEGAQPAQEAYGDPIYNGLMDPCQGHTADSYHYHSFEEKCLISSGLVSKPWTNPDPGATTPSPILGWALDGFPIYGPRECKDASCSSVIVMQSGYNKVGDPMTNAWQAYQWQEHTGDPTYLDECNGHTGPNGDYHYHNTATFPYIIGCFKGTPNGAGQNGGNGDGGMTGPKSCTGPADCTAADCPPGSVGCTCGNTPMGMACIPTCNTNADCPTSPMGMQLSCKMGVCAP